MELKDLVDKHQGKVGFVVGAAPSLHYVNVESLKPYVNIAVNSAIAKVDFANYFVSDDAEVMIWDYYQNIKPDCIKLLYADKFKNIQPNENTVLFKHKIWFDHIRKTYNPEGLVFTKDANLPLIGARTSVGTAVNLAFLMGLSPIVLLGVDCCYENNCRYFWQHKTEKKCRRLDGGSYFSIPNAGHINGHPVDTHSKDFIQYWNALSIQAKSQNIHIINASGGILDCFERMNLEEVLKKYV